MFEYTIISIQIIFWNFFWKPRKNSHCYFCIPVVNIEISRDFQIQVIWEAKNLPLIVLMLYLANFHVVLFNYKRFTNTSRKRILVSKNFPSVFDTRRTLRLEWVCKVLVTIWRKIINESRFKSHSTSSENLEKILNMKAKFSINFFKKLTGFIIRKRKCIVITF